MLDARYGSAYSGRGIVHYHMGNYKAALADYGKALESDPEDVVTLFNRALLHRDMGAVGCGY